MPPQSESREIYLKDYLKSIINEKDQKYEQRFKSIIDNIAIALTAMDKAVSKAEAAAEKRFESVNEFRGALANQQLTFATRIELDLQMKNMSTPPSVCTIMSYQKKLQ